MMNRRICADYAHIRGKCEVIFMKKIIHTFIFSFLICLLLIPVSAVYANNTEINIGDVTAMGGETVDVPITLSGNSGICGANIVISYDKNLQLTGITKGSALPSLSMTKPGSIASNLFTIVWDGTEEDNTDGTIAVLTFKTPSNAGKYSINVSYDEGDIVDGTLSPVNVTLKNGSITVEDSAPVSGTTITIGSVTAKPGESFTVPVIITGNTGICGATLTFDYSTSLALTNITKGDGFSSLAMTKPGSYSSGPFVLVWDGLEADTSNGVIAYLTFTAPETEGSYDISVSFDEGDIVDGDLNPVKVGSVQGKAIITSRRSVNIKVNNVDYTLTSKENTTGIILVSFYDESGKFISFKSFNDTETQISVSSPQNAKTAKLMWWSSLSALKPIGDAQGIELD